MHAHLVAGVGAAHGLHARVDALAGAPCLPRRKRREDLVAASLLGAKAATHARLDDAHLALGDAQGIGDLAADVEGNLRGGHHREAPEGVHVGVGAHGLHHGLLGGLGVVVALDDDVGLGKGGVDVAVLVDVVGHEVARRVSRAIGAVGPVSLVVDDGGVVQRLLHVKHGGELLVGHLHQLDGLRGRLLGLGDDHGHLVAHVAHVGLQDAGVVGAALKEGLAGQREAVGRHVVGGVDGHHARHGERAGGVDLGHQGVRLAAADELDHQGVLGREVVGVDGASRKEALGVLLDHRAGEGAAAVLRGHALAGGLDLRLGLRCGLGARGDPSVGALVAGQEAADGAHLAGVAGAAAQVAGEEAADGLVVGVGILAVERQDVHLEAGGAAAALLGALLGHAAGKLLARGAHALERGDAVAVNAGHEDGAGEHRLVVHPYGAQAAGAGLAAALDGLEGVLSAIGEERLVCGDVLGDRTPVEREADLHQAETPLGLAASAASLSSVATSCWAAASRMARRERTSASSAR